MKKTRLLAFLITVCLTTTCLLTGTVAKYSTSDAAADQGTVAKWGVVVQATGNLFNKTYAEDDTTADTIDISVSSGGNVVAPGTKNEAGMTFVLTGTAEVAVDVDFVITGKNSANDATDVFLKAGTYTDYTEYEFTGDPATRTTFTQTGDYHPIKYTLKNGSGVVLVQGTLADIEAFLESLSGRYAVGTNLATLKTDVDNDDDPETAAVATDGTYKLTWEWVYDTQAEDGANDPADTLLGNLAADSNAYGTNLTVDTDYSVETEINIQITVTQVD